MHGTRHQPVAVKGVIGHLPQCHQGLVRAHVWVNQPLGYRSHQIVELLPVSLEKGEGHPKECLGALEEDQVPNPHHRFRWQLRYCSSQKSESRTGGPGAHAKSSCLWSKRTRGHDITGMCCQSQDLVRCGPRGAQIRPMTPSPNKNLPAPGPRGAQTSPTTSILLAV